MRPRLFRILAAAALATLAPTRSIAQSFPSDAAVRSLIDGRIRDGRAVGWVIGLLEADGATRVIHGGSAGEGARPLHERTLFEIGSITKVFTGTLLAEMALRGDVALDDPVSRFLPGVRVPSRAGREITLVDLATHHSALPRLPANMPAADPLNPYADYTVAQLYDFLSDYELPRDIGSQFEYSNLAVGLLGHALALAARTSYEALVEDRILDPLDMENTGIALDQGMRELMAVGHDAARQPVPLWDLPTIAGAGALRSNMVDMLRFLRANVGEPEGPLERAMRVAHEPRHELASGDGAPDTSIGLNWLTRTVRPRIVWHNGGTGGFTSFIGFDPDRRVGVIVLSNSQHSVDDIGLHLLDPSIPLTEAPPERTEVSLPAEILGNYVGEYRLAPTFTIVITMEGNALLAKPTDQPQLPIFAESETEFFLRVVDAQITFQRSADGTVSGLILHQNGQNIPGTKVR